MKTLIVFATSLENQIQKIPSGTQILVTGIGKLNAAVSLARMLSHSEFERIINLGICGAVSPSAQIMEIFSISKVIEGDRDLMFKTQAIDIPALPGSAFTEAILVTQDIAVTTEEHRNHVLKLGGALADMEGFALAKTARSFSIPFFSLKIVSDHADNDAIKNVKENVISASKKLCSAILQIL